MLALHRPTVPVEREDGAVEWVEVDPDVAEVLAEPEAPMREARIEGDFGSDLDQWADEDTPDPLVMAQYLELLEQWYLHPARDPNATLPCWLENAPFGLLIGTRGPWPPPELRAGEACEGCDGAPLPPHAACLACLDRREATRLRALQANEGASRKYKPGRLAGGTGKAKGAKVKPARPKTKRQVG